MDGSERRFDLRKRTRTAHERLDAAVGGFCTIDEYRHYLMGLACFRAAMDGALQRVVWPAGWSWRPTALARSLDKDAIDLGLPAAGEASHDIALADQSALLGALYVLEGSTLGARVLCRRAAALGLDEAFGARHLAVLSKDLTQWHAFLLLLDEAGDFDIDQAAASANAVFALALQCFESELLVVH
ncbi:MULTISPECIES: biliverdin-producing heme oxygenase [unclassified Shinella]|uniref:biliverdin-producing heme oxygenase n=1 Tax=unclassified Shinella TaxID=2643062 RepID=UPI00225DC635|nr:MULTISPECIES: biliverdin-producing heme oxygenase [unclassified Shinella]MDC7256905.1 biliverdin-producing heme oxygenase [Shinella sp. YE25]CAI0339796.1 putative Heme oxygenase PigA [Rhizobiaceae bacterium]CAK7258187.1 heme oxygenase (biliverdin-IX-beta and delta-forming) [Shinella sp. WSC3-e]